MTRSLVFDTEQWSGFLLRLYSYLAPPSPLNSRLSRICGTDNKIVSMAVCSDGSYDIPRDLWYSFPVTCTRGGHFSIVPDLKIDDFSRSYMDKTAEELTDEKEVAANMFS